MLSFKINKQNLASTRENICRSHTVNYVVRIADTELDSRVKLKTLTAQTKINLNITGENMAENRNL